MQTPVNGENTREQQIRAQGKTQNELKKLKHKMLRPSYKQKAKTQEKKHPNAKFLAGTRGVFGRRPASGESVQEPRF